MLDQKTSFSVYHEPGYVDVVAPGVNIQSTVSQDVMGVLYDGINESDPNPPSSEEFGPQGIGTSFSAPFVAGVAAQLVSYALESGMGNYRLRKAYC